MAMLIKDNTKYKVKNTKVKNEKKMQWNTL